jgi:hypothetical protein
MEKQIATDQDQNTYMGRNGRWLRPLFIGIISLSAMWLMPAFQADSWINPAVYKAIAAIAFLYSGCLAASVETLSALLMRYSALMVVVIGTWIEIEKLFG